MASYHVSVKSGKKGSALAHSTYIARKGKYGKDGKNEDLVHEKSGNLPPWADGNTSLFWKMADTHERANGASYRELEIALPSELTIEQNIALVDKIIQVEIGEKPYQAAIHMPKAAIGNVDQPHVHIMHSHRVDDGIERSPELHFKRFNALNPAQGGCRKHSGGKTTLELKKEMTLRRERLAELQNEALAAAGHEARVDHRSHRERGIARVPERHLGYVGIQSLTDAELADLKDRRAAG